MNAEREKLGKKPIEDEDDDDSTPGGGTVERTVSTTDPESGNVNINVKGDITAGNNNGDSNVIGSEVDIHAGKNIGDDNNKLAVDADELNVSAGGDINLITNGDTEVGRITAGGDIDIEVPKTDKGTIFILKFFK